jgi:excisionase family DNA binding protein
MYITREEAAKRYGCSMRNIDKHIKRGNLRILKAGRITLIDVDQLDALCEYTKPRNTPRNPESGF